MKLILKITLITYLLALSFVILAQNQVIIGDTNHSSYNIPTKIHNKYGWSQQIYKSSEISNSGVIDAISFKVLNTLPIKVDSQKIYLVELDNNSIYTNIYKSPQDYNAILVYNDSVVYSDGWVQVNLQTPFYYSGTKNLALFYENHNGNSILNMPVFSTFFNIDETRCRYNYNDTLANAFSSHMNYSNYRNTIKLNFLDAQNDIAIQYVNTPINGAVTDSSMQISVKLKNESLNTITSYNVKYSIDNGISWKSKSDTISIYPQAALNFDFSDSNDFADMRSSGVYKLMAIAQSQGDLNSYNDTLTTSISICNGGLSGAYIIGMGTNSDFQNLTDAILAIRSCGISGPISLKIKDGVYNEHIEIDSLNSSLSFPITIESLSGNAEDVVFQFDANSEDDNYTIKISNTNYVTFKNLSINSLSYDYCDILYIYNCNNITVDNNMFYGSSIYTANSFSQHSIWAYKTENIIIKNNEFYKNQTAIEVRGRYNNNVNNISILNNKIINNTGDGIYLYNTGNTKLNNNKISSWEKHSAGIYIYNNIDSNEVINNKIDTYDRNLSLHNIIGQYLAPAIIANNLLYSSAKGTNDVFISSCTNINFDFNTLVGRSLSTSNAVFTVSGSNSGYVNAVRLRNNNIINRNDGLAINLYGYSYYTIDYNNFFTEGLIFGKYSSTVATNFSDFKVLSGTDTHSINTDILFSSDEGILTNDSNLIGAGTYLSNLSMDYNYNTRVNPPCIGAVEFVSISKDIAILNVEPVDNYDSTHNINVVVKNLGSVDITSISISCVINNGNIDTLNWTGVITPFDTAGIFVGSYALLTDSVYDIKTWINTANNTTDSNKYNDTLLIKEYQRKLAGVYIIGRSNTADFKSVKQAIDCINNVGISASVVFNIEDGIYEGQYELKESIGTDSSKTVTFQSLSGDTSRVYFTFDGDGIENSIFYANRVSFLYFKNLSFKRYNSNTSTIFYFYFADNVHVTSCALYGKLTPETFNNKGLIYAQVSNHIYIDSSKFIGGTKGINIYYANKIGMFECYIRDNIISDFGSIGLSIIGNYISSKYIIKRNNIKSSSTYNQNPKIINLAATGNIEISENTMAFSQGTNSTGIFVVGYNADNDPNYKLKIFNNYIRTDYIGIRISASYSQSKRIEILYNTLETNTSTLSESGAFLSSNVTNLLVMNNSLNSKQNTCIESYYYPNNTPTTFDYNNIFSTSTVPISINSTNYTLNSYKTTTGQDAHSISTNPVFINQNDYHMFDSVLNNSGTPISGYTTDIDGEQRDILSPDIGADEFTLYDNNVALKNINSPLSISTIGNVPLKISIQNIGLNNLLTDSFYYQVDNGNIGSNLWNGNINTLAIDSFISIGIINLTPGYHTLKVWSTKPNGAVDNDNSNDTILATIFAQVMPSISLDLATLNIDIQNCNDSIIVPFTIRNLGDIALVVNSNIVNCPWLYIDSNITHTIAPHDSLVINLLFNSLGLSQGLFSGVINLNTNDLGNPNITIPIILNANNILQQQINLGPDTIACGSYTLLADSLFNNYLWNTGNSNSSINITNSGLYSITVSNISGNCFSYDSINVTINANPIISINGLSNSYCTNDTSIGITLIPSGGTLTGPVLSGNIFDPALSGQGTFTFEYSFTDSVSCSDTVSQTVNVYSPQTISFSGLDTTYCQSTSPSLLIGNPSGGVFSGAGINQNYFNPSIAGAGTHHIAYIITDSNNCINSDSVSTIVLIPEFSIIFSSYQSSYCSNNVLDTIVATPSGGVFDGIGMNSNVFNPQFASIGSLYISYSKLDSNQCAISDSVMIAVNGAPSSSLLIANTNFCINESSIVLQGMPVGGNYSGAGIIDSIFSPSLAGDGYHDILYIYTDINNCSDSSLTTLLVDEPNIQLANDTSVCGGNTINLNGGLFSSYLWSTGETTQNISIDSTGIGYGSKNISLSISDTLNCQSSDTINIQFLNCTSINNLGKETLNFSIYPNPSTGIFNLISTEISSLSIHMQIFNEVGVRILEKDIKNTSGIINEIIDLTSYPKGVYYVKLGIKNEAIVLRVIII